MNNRDFTESPQIYEFGELLAHWELRGIREKRTVFLNRAGFKLEFLASYTNALDRLIPLVNDLLSNLEYRYPIATPIPT